MNQETSLIEPEDTESHIPSGRMLPLNSRRLGSTHIKLLAETLELPTSSSTEELRQLIDGKLMEQEREPRNVQVVVQESSRTEIRLFLMDESGPFQQSATHTQTGLQIREETEHLHETMQEMEQEVTVLKAQLEEQREELENVQLELQQEREKTDTQVNIEEVSKLKSELQKEKEKMKHVWQANCQQVSELETELSERDEIIKTLRERLRGAEVVLSERSTTPTLVSTEKEPSRRQRKLPIKRKGRAPPIEPFTRAREKILKCVLMTGYQHYIELPSGISGQKRNCSSNWQAI